MDYITNDEIEHLRETMIQTALKKGINAPETVELSRKLDSLMNQFDSFTEKTSDNQTYETYIK